MNGGTMEKETLNNTEETVITAEGTAAALEAAAEENAENKQGKKKRKKRIYKMAADLSYGFDRRSCRDVRLHTDLQYPVYQKLCIQLWSECIQHFGTGAEFNPVGIYSICGIHGTDVYCV